MQGRLTIALLGEPYVAVDDEPVACPSKKAQGLFYYLAQSGERRSRRDLARLFWGGGEDSARTSLRTALQRLPASLLPWLAVDRDHIALRRDIGTIELDTARFAALARAEDVASLDEASQLYRGDLLKGLDLDAAPEFDDWLLRERTVYRQAAQSVFDRLIARRRERAQRDAAGASSEREAAMAAARRWTTLEPAAESAHRWLMRLFFEAGQRDAALAQYEVCQRELAVALGRGPDAETRALFEAIGGAAAGAAAPPPRAPALDPALRAPELAGTSFVGRVEELATLEQLLGDPACRLLTLHALGGIGKSRLAYALANQMAARFALGAAWIALDAVASVDQLPIAVARAIGVELAPRADPATALSAALRAQERLLVLDNFEHLIEGGGAELVLAILREAPRVRILVTSREVLGVQEEWVYEVAGLAFPGPDVAHTPPPGEFPAVELFMQRARQAYLGFSPQAEWPHVVRICRLVEGLPLAIELAAAWVRTIPCGDLVHAIESEMAGLVTRHRNRPGRQHSLDAVVRTSWQLLTREQQHALAPLSIFVGGFTQDAAQAVAGATLRLLSTLVDKALVVRRNDGRCGLHELVRQFLHAQLAARSGAARETERRFAGYFAAQLGRWRAQLDGAEELDAEALLTLELPNIVAAAALWAARPGELAESTTEPLLRVYMGRGLLRQVVAAASRALADPSSLTPATQTLLLAYRARAEGMLGDLGACRQDFDAAIALGHGHRLRLPLAYASVYSIAVEHLAGQHATALRRLDEMEPLIADLGDPGIRMRARYFAGLSREATGHFAEAEQSLREALALATEIGSPTFLATARSSLATAVIRMGRLEEGEALLRDALALFEKIGSAHNVARVLNSLAVVALWRSNGAEGQASADHASRAYEIFERTGFEPGQYAALETLGQAMQALGRFDEARRHFERAAANGPASVASDARLHLGLMHLDRGNGEAALQAARDLLDTALAHKIASIERMAIFLAGAVAVREPRWVARAEIWLRRLLGVDDLDFELKRNIEALLATLPAQEASTAAPAECDPIAEIQEFLDRRG